MKPGDWLPRLRSGCPHLHSEAAGRPARLMDLCPQRLGWAAHPPGANRLRCDGAHSDAGRARQHLRPLHPCPGRRGRSGAACSRRHVPAAGLVRFWLSAADGRDREPHLGAGAAHERGGSATGRALERAGGAGACAPRPRARLSFRRRIGHSRQLPHRHAPAAAFDRRARDRGRRRRAQHGVAARRAMRATSRDIRTS